MYSVDEKRSCIYTISAEDIRYKIYISQVNRIKKMKKNKILIISVQVILVSSLIAMIVLLCINGGFNYLSALFLAIFLIAGIIDFLMFMTIQGEKEVDIEISVKDEKEEKKEDIKDEE